MDTTCFDALPRCLPRPSRRRLARSASPAPTVRALPVAETPTANRRRPVPSSQPLADVPEAVDQPGRNDGHGCDREWFAVARTSDARLAALLIELAADAPESTLAALIARAVARCVDDSAMLAALARSIARFSADLAATVDAEEAAGTQPSDRAVNAALVPR